MATETDTCALAEFRHQLRLFLAFSERSARAAGVLPQQHQLLLAVKGLPSGERASIKNVAERLLLKHHSVVELADRLAEHDLLERRASDVDRREIHLHVTPRGERLLRRLSITHHTELRSAGPALIAALSAVVAPPRRAPRARRRAS